jgi:hypothetical protein
MKLVRLALNVLGAFLLLLGFIWILQGTNILPGSFMTGQPIWAAAGAVVALGAIAMLVAMFASGGDFALRPSRMGTSQVRG